MNDKISVLTLETRSYDLLLPRQAARWPQDRPRPMLDVFDTIIDGTSFMDLVFERWPGYSLRSPLWVGSPRLLSFHARALLGEGPSDLASTDPVDHVALLMCGYCINGGCGVLSARITRDDGRVRWSDIGRQVPNLGEIGPFTFDADQYDQSLRPLLDAVPQ